MAELTSESRSMRALKGGGISSEFFSALSISGKNQAFAASCRRDFHYQRSHSYQTRRYLQDMANGLSAAELRRQPFVRFPIGASDSQVDSVR
jgi:hypothetical protein